MYVYSSIAVSIRLQEVENFFDENLRSFLANLVCDKNVTD